MLSPVISSYTKKQKQHNQIQNQSGLSANTLQHESYCVNAGKYITYIHRNKDQFTNIFNSDINFFTTNNLNIYLLELSKG